MLQDSTSPTAPAAHIPSDSPICIALAGNPNVGKSTLFNGLTGLHQHTGNWPGVTVSSARGTFLVDGQKYLLVDLPGTYSLSTRSQEEEITRNYLNSGEADLILLVSDGTCLERGLNLLKQILTLERIREDRTPVILCVNLCDEARKKGIAIDFELLQDVLQIPAIPCCARNASSLDFVRRTLADSRSRLFCYDCLDFDPRRLTRETVRYTRPDYRKREEMIDRIVTAPVIGKFFMILLLMGVFWLTMSGANVPADRLWDALFWLEGKLAALMTMAGVPAPVISALVYGVYRVLAWVVSVMLPPMAIFFPLFTLLEDLGYLPRVAFNMDRAFKRCHACGKQCLTMAMGLGCNAAGVTGCRIIDSPRERLIAILSNALIPCNGRLPLLFTMITLIFMSTDQHGETSWAPLPSFFSGGTVSLLSALILTLLILLGIGATLAVSWLLSHTVLRGVPSAFTLELPPYRRPQVGRVIVRSIFDRTLFVLGRAVVIAAPAGLIIWILANVWYVGPEQGWFALPPLVSEIGKTGAAIQTGSSTSLLSLITGFFDPLGRLMGLDGVILAAFLLGFPANEIVVPIILMAYMQTGTLVEMSDPSALLHLLTAHGWTRLTAVCMMIFCLFHWPCSTTVLTIRKETGSWRWTGLAVALPTILGTGLCILTAWIVRLIF